MNLKVGQANMGVEGLVKADASTSVTGGLKIGATKKEFMRRQ